MTGPLMQRARLSQTDAGITYAQGDDAYQADPWQLLMAMARRQRDGASHAAIISEFDLTGEAKSPFVLERALTLGRQLLDHAIASGREPAETKQVVVLPDDDDDDG